MLKNVDEMYTRIIFAARLCIFLFEKVELLQIQSFWQMQKESKVPN